MLCNYCDGSGVEDGPGFEWPIRCPVCNGTGTEPDAHDEDPDEDED